MFIITSLTWATNCSSYFTELHLKIHLTFKLKPNKSHNALEFFSHLMAEDRNNTWIVTLLYYWRHAAKNKYLNIFKGWEFWFDVTSHLHSHWYSLFCSEQFRIRTSVWETSLNAYQPTEAVGSNFDLFLLWRCNITISQKVKDLEQSIFFLRLHFTLIGNLYHVVTLN